MSDDVKTLYRQSQDLLTRSALDSRNILMHVVDFYDKIITVFNDVTFIPETKYLPNVHEYFEESKKIPLGEYRMSRGKAKDLIVSIWPKFINIVRNYELSGSGSGQRAEEDSDYGRVNIEQCVEGDNKEKFMESDIKETFVLYWWHKLDVVGFVQFTLYILHKFQRINASDFQLVSNMYSINSPKKEKDKKDT